MKLKPLFLLALLFVLTAAGQAQDPVIRVSTPEQIKAGFVKVPCENRERLTAVRTLFEQAGAPSAEISIDHYKTVENLVVTKRGQSAETIIVGAHYDKVADGCGAVDNWTGIVVLAHLYHSIKDVALKKTLVFVAFGKEEGGLVGSSAMVKAMTEDQVSEYCAMVNIDSLGLAPPQVADNLSSKKLEQFTLDLAKEMNLQFAHATVQGAEADSLPFMTRKIPAVTIHGLTNQWPTILHTFRDQSSKVNPMSVYLGYRFALGIIARLDDSPCAAYRER
ncbi:MAG TPA: M20/M25/M40 family metallo-hydrolase [Pyrinomonadaceae bacterium]|nr:M20/M25/M40 family metallo-hydrolase [Pyrinomonadaceae bacterium]